MKSKFRKGDILLISSRCDPFSWLIMLGTHSKISHTTWILNDNYLLESRGSAISVSPISKYLGRTNKWRYKCKLYRIKKCSKEKIDKAMNYGLSLLKKRSYRKFIWSLFLIGIGKKKKTSQLSCSGFVATCLAKVGIKLHPTKNPFFVTPGDVARSKLLKRIYKKDLK